MTSKHNLSSQQVIEARQHFNKFDKDKSGTIDFKELKELLESTLHTKLSEKMYERYVMSQFSTTDKNNDNLIQFDEFLILYDKLYHTKEIPIGVKAMEKKDFRQTPSVNAPKVAKKPDLTDDQIKEARQKFDQYDMDKSGTIDMEEMKKIMQDTIAGKNTSQFVINRMATMNLNEADKNGDGHIGFEEFLKVYARIFADSK